MATSTTPQPYTADRPENSTTSVDASVGSPLYRSLARWMFSRSALISSRRRRVYVLLLGSQNKAVCGKQLVRFLFERSQDDRRQSATIHAFVVAQSAQDFLEVSLRSLEEGGQVLAFGGLKSLQSQALEIGFGCRNPVRCVRSRSDPVSLEDGVRLHRSLPDAFQGFSRVGGPERLANLPLPYCRSQIGRDFHAQEVAGAALLKAGMSGGDVWTRVPLRRCTNEGKPLKTQ
jgi:hypothetical protein